MQRRRATRQLAEVGAEAKQQELRGLAENSDKSIRDHMPKSATGKRALEETHEEQFDTDALAHNVLVAAWHPLNTVQCGKRAQTPFQQ